MSENENEFLLKRISDLEQKIVDVKGLRAEMAKESGWFVRCNVIALDQSIWVLSFIKGRYERVRKRISPEADQRA
jgi:hypothetical protein